MQRRWWTACASGHRGNGILALFGALIAHEDQALRACYAALVTQAAMRDYMEEVRRTHGSELRIRVGLNSGKVVVRAIGNDLHMDYSAVGQTTHLAAHMEQMATPGSIRLMAATLRLVEGLVQVLTLGPIPVKGLAAPMEVCELVGASTMRVKVTGQVLTLDAVLQGTVPALLEVLPADSPFLQAPPWTRNWACARSWLTATSASAPCTPRQANGSRPVLHCPPLPSCIAPGR